MQNEVNDIKCTVVVIAGAVAATETVCIEHILYGFANCQLSRMKTNRLPCQSLSSVRLLVIFRIRALLIVQTNISNTFVGLHFTLFVMFLFTFTYDCVPVSNIGHAHPV